MVRRIFLLLILLCVPRVLAQALPDLGDVSSTAITPADERRLGERIMREIRRDPAYLDDAEVADYANSLGARLTAPFENAVQEFFNKPDALVFGRETANQAGERFSSAVTAVLAENQASSTIVIVSHGTVISLFLSRLTGRLAYPIWSDLGLPGYMLVDLQSNKLAAYENIG